MAMVVEKDKGWLSFPRRQLMSENVLPPKGFDVQEVKSSSQNPNMIVEEGGTIDLGKQLDPLEMLERLEKMSEQREKRRIRKHITYLTLTLAFVWIILGLIDYLRTENTFLLAASSTTSGPILIIMGYYFGEQLLQKHIHRGS
jgi:hypothetical protein